jgi:anti-sigma factor RsiW
MNHQHFENWLLSEETLLPEQAETLREHLTTCKDCARLEASWKGARQVLRQAPVLGPVAGFAARWQVRLAEEQRRTQHRQSVILLGLTSAIAFFILLLLSVPALDLLRSPSHLLMIGVYRLMTLFSTIDSTSEMVLSVFEAIFRFVPQTAWIFIFGVLIMVSVLWMAVYQQLTSQQRVKP